MFPFYTPWKRQKTRDFLTFSGIMAWNGLITSRNIDDQKFIPAKI